MPVIWNNKIIGAFEFINKKGIAGRVERKQAHLDKVDGEMLDYFVLQFGTCLAKIIQIEKNFVPAPLQSQVSIRVAKNTKPLSIL